MAALNIRSRATEDEIAAWAGRVKMFFILAIGRSGSMFLAHLLDQAPEARVYHEPTRVDFAAYTEAFYDQKAAEDYLSRYRKKEIYLRMRDSQSATYGEVNTNLRRHCNALKRVFPDATFVHLVRDGRDVIRSMMSRRTFRSWDPVTSLIRPQEGDPQCDTWPGMNRFEKLCWYWSAENRYLRNCVQRTVRFEDLISDYGYFEDSLLSPLQLEIADQAWREASMTPKNVTRRYRIPHWSSWDVTMQRAFERICGEEMARNGYRLDWQPIGAAQDTT
jgi:hypothetical protein